MRMTTGVRHGGIRTELVFGLVVVILISCLVTYTTVLLWSRRNFDTLVEKNDVETAKSYAASLAEYYKAVGSWQGVEEKIENLRHHPSPVVEASDPRFAEKRHSRDTDFPLVVTDAHGVPVYVGIRTKEGEPNDKLTDRLKTMEGERVVVDGSTVAYVFFKSMIFRSYNPQEEAFIASLRKSIGISVFVGLILSLSLGAALASRFAKPITVLDAAVKKVSSGNMSARVHVTRKDEIGSLAGSFNLMADKLQTAETARQNLLADIAHELRTPVSIIQANLEMILDGVYEADTARLKALYEETRILTGLISDLRSLSDLEIGVVPVRPERISLSALIDESCRKLRPLFDEKGISLDVSSGDTIFVLAEEDRIRQVLRNILGNALKYAPADSAVEVSTERIRPSGASREFARVTIADCGEGVPDGDTTKIFERFYRVDSSRSRKSGGRGLGLAISKGIVRTFGGEIGAYNREPHGLAVWFDLPVAFDTKGSG